MHGAKSNVCVNALCNDGLLVLGRVVDLEELAGTQSKDHGVIVFLELVVDLGEHQSSEVAVAEAFIFEKGFSRGECQCDALKNGSTEL